MEALSCGSAVCPVFLEPLNGGPLQQVGSGVLIYIAPEYFLVTAAHVVDLSERGALLVPGGPGLVPLEGFVSNIRVPANGRREDDNLDIAYYRLAANLPPQLKDHFQFVQRSDAALYDEVREGDLYSFVGYPWRKGVVSGGKAESEIFTFTGTAAERKRYAALGLDPAVNVALRFRRRKSVSAASGQRNTAPLPHGMSGGGFFAWPKNVASRSADLSKPFKLAAVGHTYLEREHLLIGTSIDFVVGAIMHNNPELSRQHSGEDTDAYFIVPGARTVCIAWYEEREWTRCAAEASDGQAWHDTWREWRQAAIEQMEDGARAGLTLVRISITAAEVRAFCDARRIPRDGHARTLLLADKYGQTINSSTSS